jgi:hypothetical protein
VYSSLQGRESDWDASPFPDPIMRRPRADREEKRVTHWNEMVNG